MECSRYWACRVGRTGEPLEGVKEFQGMLEQVLVAWPVWEEQNFQLSLLVQEDTGVDGSGITVRGIALCGCKALQGQAGCVLEDGRGMQQGVGELCHHTATAEHWGRTATVAWLRSQSQSQNILSWKGPVRITESNS